MVTNVAYTISSTMLEITPPAYEQVPAKCYNEIQFVVRVDSIDSTITP